MHQLALHHSHFQHLPANPRAQRHDVALHLGVIGVFIKKNIVQQVAGGKQGNY
jgi:hypothetical protein